MGLSKDGGSKKGGLRFLGFGGMGWLVAGGGWWSSGVMYGSEKMEGK